MHRAETINLQPLLDFLKDRSGNNQIDNSTTENRAPTVSFAADGINPETVAQVLAEKNIGIADGNCYADPLMDALHIEPEHGVVRLSFVD
jgi:selenocysteine lyase/cysteine desulfurase